jgi:uncharacterized protein (DUF608 family)
MATTLFPLDLPEREWAEFAAAGFDGPVAGCIHRGTRPPDCGMPLGNVGSGCIDLEADGTWGLSTLFNSLNPRRGPLQVPILGLGVGLQTWVLTTRELSRRRGILWMDLCRGGRQYQDPLPVREIHYWGHYPVADLEFVSDAPVHVGLRAWSPFLPGDVPASIAPGAVFEVHLRNRSDQAQHGTLAFSFPGPSEAEAGTSRLRRRPLRGRLQGVAVSGRRAGYALGVLDETAVRVGGDLGVEALNWACIAHDLPWAEHQPGAALAVDFDLAPGASRVIRFVLTWYSPQWQGSGSPVGGGNTYTHMYAAHYRSATAVARWLARRHADLLPRVLAWQQEVYAERDLPPWLRDGLVNILHQITETAVWGQAQPPIGAWCQPADGIFALNESPRWCPQMECIPCSFYGNLPVVYLFPTLALSTLRAYRGYQYPSGAAPWVFGGVTTGTPPYELALPSPGYASRPQATLDGPCYVEMVDKLWQRTGNDAVLQEFYASVKQNTAFTMNLRPGAGAAGIVSMPTDNLANDWFESCELFGIVPHIGGAHLAQLRLAGRMARAMGDDAFAAQCEQWFADGSQVLETEAWAGTHYLLFHERETGKISDVVMGYQLDGEWMARFHGLPGVFRPDRVDQTLATLKQTSVALSPCGALTFCKAEAAALTPADWDPGYWGAHGVHPPGTFMLAMTYAYRGQVEFGLELARRTVHEVVQRGWYWDWPVAIDAVPGPRTGFDYYQNMVLWSLAAAARGQDLTGPCQPGGLVDRIERAARAR